MGIAVTKNEFKERFDAFTREVERKQIERLQRLGEMCVAHARNIPASVGFMDRTGNLRSSIGYMVFVDGIPVKAGDFETVQPNEPHTDGVDYNGAATGEALCRQIGGDTTNVCLVVVAGMHYARYVESKGRDVLTSAEHLAEKEIGPMLDQLIANIRRAADD